MMWIRLGSRRGAAGVRALIAAGAVVLLAACGSDDGTGPTDDDLRAPRGVAGEYLWQFEGWQGTDPVGTPTVRLTWELPERWNGEAFRIYGRRTDTNRDLLIATVTSCSEQRCVYDDANIVGGRSYTYFITSIDERSGRESAASPSVRVDVPTLTRPAAPQPTGITEGDGALLLRWRDEGATVLRYQVWLVGIDGQSYLYQVGETDGTAFLDTRTSNGSRYTYRISLSDENGHYSTMSAPISGAPRTGGPRFSVAEARRAGIAVGAGERYEIRP